MLIPDLSLFIGAKTESGYSGYVAEGPINLILEVPDGLSYSDGETIISHLKKQLLKANITSLALFDQELSTTLQQANLPIVFSVSAAYIHNGLVYLKTVGNGQVYIKRKDEFAKIISSNSTASGPLEKDDFYMLTSSCFTGIVGTDEQLKKIALGSDLYSIVDSIYNHIQESDDKGSIALFLSIIEKSEDEGDDSVLHSPNDVEYPENIPRSNIAKKSSISFNPFKNLFHKKAKIDEGTSEPAGLGAGKKKKVMTGVVVVLLLAILVWSVGLGYQRRTDAEMQTKIHDYKIKITADLNHAQNSADTDPAGSKQLIEQAKADLENFKREFGKKDPADIASLSTLVTEKENKTLKKEDKLYNEFYDLTVEDKNANGTALYIDGNKGAILDKAAGKVYILSFSSKSIEKRTVAEMKQASLISLYQNTVYLFLQDKGIFQVDENEKVKKIIDTDKDWGTVTDMKVYNGNIYLLGSSRSSVYKYVITESGYSDKKQYFQSDTSTTLATANSLSIDSSLYIGLSDILVKYKGGEKADFSTSYPEGVVKIQKAFTTENLQKVYIWDKEKGVVYETEKSGQYNRQVQSSILHNGTDLVVIDNSIYILDGAKIYQISI